MSGTRCARESDSQAHTQTGTHGGVQSIMHLQSALCTLRLAAVPCIYTGTALAAAAPAAASRPIACMQRQVHQAGNGQMLGAGKLSSAKRTAFG